MTRGTAAIATGDKIICDEKEVGEITSVATLGKPSGDRTIALGYIRREVGVPGREVTIGAVTATVIQLPLEGVALEPTHDSLLHEA